MRRLLPAAFLAIALLLPAAAHADSIVYTKAHDVWVSEPDGSSARQLTSDGGYQSPTQADDGAILVQRGTRFLRLDRSGRVLATINSVLTDKPVSVNAVGPFDPVISPDGTKLAYWLGLYSSWNDYRNNIEWTRTGSVVVWQDARDGKILGTTHYYEEPTWLPGSDGALLFEETNALTAQVVAVGVGEDHTKIRQWFHDSETKPANEEYWKPIGSGDLTRAVDRLAVLRGGTHIGNGGLSEGTGNTIATYGVHLPGPPTMECIISDAVGGKFGRPTWSPDGTSLAWQEGNGIWSIAIGHDCSGTQKLVIPGGAEPDWGPAAPTGGGSGPGHGPNPGPAASTVRVPRSFASGGRLKISVTCTGACRASATARAHGRVVAKATKRLTGGGKLSLRPKRLRGARRLAVKVTVKPDGGAATSVKRKVHVH